LLEKRNRRYAAKRRSHLEKVASIEPFLASRIPLDVMALVAAEPEQLPVWQARAGDPAAWELLFRRYQLPLYAYIFELVHDEQASLDIIQESFINAFRYIDALREDHKFGGWLFGIAHQKCLQRWRSKDRENAVREELEDPEPCLDEGPDTLLIRAEQQQKVLDLVNRLPLPQRSVVLLHFLEDFSIEEIVRITGALPGTVKSRLHYAKRALRELIEKEES
jgi:RNA polymerase sigma-70 factor (ECF subfamily)